MDFFHSDIVTEHGKKVFKFSVATQFWIFAVVLVVFTAVTVASFWLWERGLRRKDKDKFEAVRRDSTKMA